MSMSFIYKDSDGNSLGTVEGVCWAGHNITVDRGLLQLGNWDGSMTVCTGPIVISKRRANLFIKKVVESIIPNARHRYNISVGSVVSFDTNIKNDPTIEVYILSSMLRSIEEYPENINAVLFMMQQGIRSIPAYTLGRFFRLAEKGPRLRDGSLFWSSPGNHYFVPHVGSRLKPSLRTGDFIRSVKLMESGVVTNYLEKGARDTGQMPLSLFSLILRRHEDIKNADLHNTGTRMDRVITSGWRRRSRVVRVTEVKKYVQEAEELL